MPRGAARRAIGAALILLLVPAVAGWSNGTSGGDSFGTHDWVLYEANRIAVADGVQWLDWSVAQPATDDPDTVLHDTYYHVYDIWGSPYGNAPKRVQELYDETVQSLRDGDRTSASRSFGLLAHYYADVCNPLHTDQCPAEEAVHGPYELAAQGYTDEIGVNSAWVVPDGVSYVADVTALAEQAASVSHASYQALVDTFVAHGMDAQALAITRESANRAANGLADLMAGAARDAQLPTQEPARSLPDTPTPVAQVVTASDSVPASPVVSASAPAPRRSARRPARAQSVLPTPAAPVFSSLLFWVVISGAFACALFGALTARERSGR
jgi:hypothetical protein